MPEHDEQEERPSLRWKTLAGFIVLVSGIGFFLLGALVPLRADLSAPAAGLIFAGCVFFFGVQVGDWMPAILRVLGRALAESSKGTPHDPE